MLVRAVCPDCGANLEVDVQKLPGEKIVKPADLVRMHKISKDCVYELRKAEDR